MPDDSGPAQAKGTLGAQVRAARVAKGVTLRGLAASLEVSPATLSQIENGHTGLSVARLSLIADALDVTVPQILADEVRLPVRLLPPGGRPGQDRTPVGRTWREYGPLGLDSVLQAALDEIVEIGYHGATVRSIAARCQLSVSTIYHHYDSKQQMLMALLQLVMADLLQRARAARDEGGNPVERFSLLVEHLALCHTYRRDLAFVGASEMRSLEPGNHRRIARQRTALQRVIDHEVDAAVRDGDFRNDHPREASRAIVTMCTALPTWWRPGGPLTPEQVAEQHVGFALDLMRRRSAAA